MAVDGVALNLNLRYYGDVSTLGMRVLINVKGLNPIKLRKEEGYGY